MGLKHQAPKPSSKFFSFRYSTIFILILLFTSFFLFLASLRNVQEPFFGAHFPQFNGDLKGSGSSKSYMHNKGNLDVYFASNNHGSVNISLAFEIFNKANSVSLPYWCAKMVTNVAVTWPGIWYEIMHSKLLQELLLIPKGGYYTQHICISSSAGEVLMNIYQLPQRNVQVILNGVDETEFTQDQEAGARFREKHAVPSNASIVMGVAGRLVRDKGHPLLYEAFSSIVRRHPSVFLLVAGAGPWRRRYAELGPNVKILGALEPLELSILQCARCVCIVGTVVADEEFGYTFSPNVKSFVEALELAIRDGSSVLKRKGLACKKYVVSMFAATKMASAYERFCLCMKNEKYCQYPLPTDC
ncbi:unnamed protein product [Malus baccata var. baccata]